MAKQDPDANTISTHALREEGDGTFTLNGTVIGSFLPTPSARRATDIGQLVYNRIDISTHALREEGDPHAISYTAEIESTISTHALREEGDNSAARWISSRQNFYPRPPRGGRRLP